MIRTLLHFRNLDSTLDLNDQFSKFFKRGLVDGGQVLTVAGQLAVDVTPFKLMGVDGMVVIETTATQRLAVPPGQTSVIVFKSQYVPNAEPVFGFEVLEISAYAARIDKDYLCVFATVTLGVSATEVLVGNISYQTRDEIDPIGRLNSRGTLTSTVLLPTSNNRPGDFYTISSGSGDVPEIHAWNGVQWLNITDAQAIASDLNAHRSNLYNNEIHLTDEQAIAALGTSGTPGVEPIAVTINIPTSTFTLASGISNDSLVTGKLVNFLTTGTLPTGVTSGTDYYAIRIDDLNFRIATSPANAGTNTFVALGGAQAGIHQAVWEENRYVTSTDPRLPAQAGTDALIGYPSQPPPSATNPFVTAAYSFAAPTGKGLTASSGPIVMLGSEGPFYVGLGGAGTAQNFFKLYHATLPREYVDGTSQISVNVTGVFKDAGLTQPLIPSGEASVIADNGFYTGPLYLSISATMNDPGRVIYGQKRQLDQIDRGAFMRVTPQSAQLTQEAIQAFAEISGRQFDDTVPTDEQNINLRLGLNALSRYSVSTTAGNLVLSESEFKRLREYPEYATEFALDTDETELVSGNKTYTVLREVSDVTAFDATITQPDVPFVAVIQYSAAPAGIANVLPGHLFVDGAGSRFRILNRNPAVNDRVLIYTGPRNVSTATGADAGRIVAANNPRQLELTHDHRTSFGTEIIPIEAVEVIANEIEELPPGGSQVGAGSLFTLIGTDVLPGQGAGAGGDGGRSAFRILPKAQNNRYQDRVRLYGNWKTDSALYPNSAIGDVSQGVCGIEYTGRIQDLVLLTGWSDQVPYGYRIFVDGVYHSQKYAILTETVAAGGALSPISNAAMATFVAQRPQLRQVSMGLSLSDSEIHTVRVEITTPGALPFVLSGIGIQFGNLKEEPGKSFFGATYHDNATESNPGPLVTDNFQSAQKAVRYLDADGVRQTAIMQAPYYADGNRGESGTSFTVSGISDLLYNSRVGDVLYMSGRGLSSQNNANAVYRRIIGQNAGSRTLDQAIGFTTTQVEYAFKVPVRPDTGAAVLGAAKSDFDKEYARLSIADWSVGNDNDISKLPVLSTESRKTVLMDGQTALVLTNCTRVDSGLEGAAEGLQIETGGAMQVTAFCSRMDLVFTGTGGAANVTLEIDGAYTHTLALSGTGVERHTVFFDANLQSHTVRITASAAVIVSEWIFFELADPKYVGTGIAEYNLLRNSNSKLYPEYAYTATHAFSNQGLRVFDPSVSGARFFGTAAYNPAVPANPIFGSSVLMAVGSGMIFEMYGSGFELFWNASIPTDLSIYVNGLPLNNTNYPTVQTYNETSVSGATQRTVATDLPFGTYRVEVRVTLGSAELYAIGVQCAIGSVAKRNAEDTSASHLHFTHFKDLRRFLTLEPQQIGIVAGSVEGVAVEVTEESSEDAVALSPAPGYRAIIADSFREVPTSPTSRVDASLTTAVHNFANNMYRLKFENISGDVTGGNISAGVPSVGFALAVNDIVQNTTTGEFRRISAVAPYPGVPTLDAPFTSSGLGIPLLYSKAVYTKDLTQLGDASEQTRLIDIFGSDTINNILIDYQDSAVLGNADTPIDTVPDITEPAHVVVAASSAYTTPVSTQLTAPYARPVAPDMIPDYPLTTNGTQLGLVFFVNKDTAPGLGTKNLLGYQVSAYQQTSMQNGGVLRSAYCYNDGSQVEVQCLPPVNVSGATEVELNFAYVMNVNSGTVDGDLEVIVDGKVIPRVVAGAILSGDLAYTEVTTSRIRFNQDLITATPQVSFHFRRRQGLNDVSVANTGRIGILGDIWVGSAADVAAGFAQYSTLQAAVTAAAQGAHIRVRSNFSSTEAVTISKRLIISGAGYDSYINGIITLDANCDYSTLQNIRCQQVAILSGGDGNIINACFFTNAPTDSGTGNNFSGCLTI